MGKSSISSAASSVGTPQWDLLLLPSFSKKGYGFHPSSSYVGQEKAQP